MAPECGVDAGCDGFHCCAASKSAAAARGRGTGIGSASASASASSPSSSSSSSTGGAAHAHAKATSSGNPMLVDGKWPEHLLVQAVIEVEGMEVTVSAGGGGGGADGGGADDDSDFSPAGAAPIARTGGASAAAITASGTTMRCPVGTIPTSGVDATGKPTVDKAWLEKHCSKQFPIDPWSIDDEMWEAMRCSSSPALH